VPFEEDEKNSKIWFLDHHYHENMYAMFKKVNAREQVVGWYHTGPKLRENDLEIHEVLRRYVANPVLVVIDVQLKEELEIPTRAYVAVDEQQADGTAAGRRLAHLPAAMGALEAEEVGVEHLLRDVKDNAPSSLGTRVHAKLRGLKSLHTRLRDVHAYLRDVAAGRLPPNHTVLTHIQDLFNLLPNLSEPALVRAFAVKLNDMMLAVYLCALIRSVLALHTLIRNKIALRDAERKQDQPPEAKPPADAKKGAAPADAKADGKKPAPAADSQKDASKDKGRKQP
jgi:26S proteasome regulatory subunit N8